MAVNLEELAIKSIEQYAAFNVKLMSIEETLKEINRKNERREEQFVQACEKISRMEDKLSFFTDDKKEIIRDIGIMDGRIVEVEAAVGSVMSSFVNHQDDHCSKCKNEGKLDDLSLKVNKLENPDKELKEARKIATSRWMLLTLRALNTKFGLVFIVGTLLAIVTTFYEYYAYLAKIYKYLTFAQ
jgi:chromosome segregation ATPase